MPIPVKNKLPVHEPFRIRKMKEEIRTTLPHGHKNYLEIIYLDEGAGIHQVDHQRYQVLPDSLYLIMPGQIHNWELTAVPKGYVLMIRPDFFLGHPLYDALFRPFPAAFRSCYRPGADRAQIRAVFENITAEEAARRPGCVAVIRTYIQLLFDLLGRDDPAGTAGPVPAVLSGFFLLLDRHYPTCHEVAWYALQLGITPKTLNTTCRRFLGKTPGMLISERLTSEAKTQLLYTSHTLSELAFSLGFTDLPHFSKFFKRQTGVSPLVYRKGIS